MTYRMFDWLLADSIVADQYKIEDLDKKVKSQLMLNLFPSGETLLHMIAAKANKED